MPSRYRVFYTLRTPEAGGLGLGQQLGNVVGVQVRRRQSAVGCLLGGTLPSAITFFLPGKKKG